MFEDFPKSFRGSSENIPKCVALSFRLKLSPILFLSRLLQAWQPGWEILDDTSTVIIIIISENGYTRRRLFQYP